MQYANLPATSSATDEGADQEDIQAFAAGGYRYALSIVRNHGDAEELVQEAFCRLHRNGDRDSATDEAPNRAVFFATVRNLCIDLIRRRKVRNEISLHSLESNGHTVVGGFEKADASQEILEIVNQAIQRLPENWSEAFRLRTNGDLSYSEIAEVVGATKAQVRTWIFRARQKLRDRLEHLRPAA